MNKEKLVRYQVNPTKNWGPGSRPKNVAAPEATTNSAPATSADESMGDLTGTAIDEKEEVKELGLAADPAEFPPDAEVAEPGATAAEAVPTTVKRARAEGDDERDGKKIKLDDEDEESALNM